jgi:hypothetical protein
MMSQCCGVRSLKAKSSGGWYINGELVHEWWECSQCKQACDIVEPLITDEDKEIENE